jgi:DNA-binding NarL/FixJ family response regulator
MFACQSFDYRGSAIHEERQTDRRNPMDVPRQSRLKRCRVLIVDDHPVVRDGLKALIGKEDDLEICGEACDVDEAIERVRELQPQVIVLDLSLKSSHGLTALAKLHTLAPRTRIVVWSGQDEALFAERVLRAGALAYVNKQEHPGRVVEAIRQALRNEIWISKEISAQLLSCIHPSEQDTRLIAGFSNRELEVFEFLGRGCTTKQIANRLGLSVKTVENHLAHMKRKLKAETQAELIRDAVAWHLERSSPRAGGPDAGPARGV